MNDYLFVLGKTPKLSMAEIANLLKYLKIDASYLSLSRDILLVNTSKSLDKLFINKLGGTVKIAKVISDNLVQFSVSNIVSYLSSLKQKKIIFGVSFYAENISPKTILNYSIRIKKKLKKSGKKVRFICPQDKSYLSSAQVYNKIMPEGVEIILVKYKERYFLGKTIGVQNIKLFSALDYKIPHSDPKEGMVPPKLARMMINLSLTLDNSNNRFSLYDPFCGQGRIMLEGLYFGFEVFASDIDRKKIEATQKNVTWLIEKFDLSIKKDYFRTHIFFHDAQIKNQYLKNKKINAIVTEPNLGPVYKKIPINHEIRSNFQKLSKLYLNSFSAFKYILSNNSKVVCVFPQINNFSLLDVLVDKIKNFGYYKLSDFLYERKYQVVKRHIGVFVTTYE